MEKKMYYRIDGGDTPVITPDLKSIFDILESEAQGYDEIGTNLVQPEWTIDLLWLTEEEFEKLPEA